MWLTARVMPPATPTIVSCDAETLGQQGTRATEQEYILTLDELIKENFGEASYLSGPRWRRAGLTEVLLEGQASVRSGMTRDLKA